MNRWIYSNKEKGTSYYNYFGVERLCFVCVRERKTETGRDRAPALVKAYLYCCTFLNTRKWGRKRALWTTPALAASSWEESLIFVSLASTNWLKFHLLFNQSTKMFYCWLQTYNCVMSTFPICTHIVGLSSLFCYEITFEKRNRLFNSEGSLVTYYINIQVIMWKWTCSLTSVTYNYVMDVTDTYTSTNRTHSLYLMA